MASSNDSNPGAQPRLVSGLLLLVVMGVQLGWSNALTARVESGPAAAELAGARRLGERVVRVLRSLIERGGAERREAEGFGGRDWREPGRVAGVDVEVVAGVVLGEWELDLPPPVASV